MQSICVANRDRSCFFFYLYAQVAGLTFPRQVDRLADVNFPKQSSAHIVRFSFWIRNVNTYVLLLKWSYSGGGAENVLSCRALYFSIPWRV